MQRYEKKLKNANFSSKKLLFFKKICKCQKFFVSLQVEKKNKSLDETK